MGSTRGEGIAGCLRRFLSVGAGFGLMAFLIFVPAVASADHSLCPPGSDAGECGDRPRGVAVDEASGNVYVMDRGNLRVNVFEPDGDFLFAFGWGVLDGDPELQKCNSATGCLSGSSGSGAGQFGADNSLAIDNNPLSPGYRSVYIGKASFRVQKFDHEGNFLLSFGTQGEGPGQINSATGPIAVAGSDGMVYVGDRVAAGSRVQKFSPAGAFLGQAALSEPSSPLEALAVDSAGNLYAAFFDFSHIGIWKYAWAEPAAVKLNRFDFGADVPRTRQLAFSNADELFAYQLVSSGAGDRKVITKFDVNGAKLARFGYGQIAFDSTGGLGVNSATSDLYLSGDKNVIHISLPSPGPLLISTDAAPVGNTKATFNAVINPEGALSTYHFEYVDEESFQQNGFDDAVRVPQDQGDDPSLGGAGDFDLHEVSQQIGCADPATEAGLPNSPCLAPEADYRFRVFAENSAGGGNSPLEGQFTTRSALELEATWASQVGPDSARLHARVNPLGIPTTGFFEYVREDAYQADLSGGGDGFGLSTQSETLNFGSGEIGKEASAFVADLAPGTYRYRAVVDDPLIDPLAGPLRSFSTVEDALPAPACPNDKFRIGPGSRLPDCRAYEMVSPVDKEGGDIISLGNINSNAAHLNQSSSEGGRFTYSSFRAFGDAQSSPFTSQYLATRVPDLNGEWDEGKEGWLTNGISPPRGVNILNQGASLDTEFKAFSEDLCAAWLRHDTNPILAPGAIFGYANLFRRHNCDLGAGAYTALTTVKPPTRPPIFFAPELQGLSADGATAVFRVDDALTSKANPGKAPEGSNYQCYEAGGNGLRLISVLPDGSPAKGHCSIGTAAFLPDGRDDSVLGGISADGSRIFFTISTGVTGPGQIYVRVNGANPTVAVSGAVSNAAARFRGASTSGSKAIFTIAGGPSSSGEDLYEFNVDAQQAQPIATGVIGVVGMSEDVERIYFVSRESLAAGGTEGAPNLYLRDIDGDIEFVAALASGDVPTDGNVPSPISIQPNRHTARVSPDGAKAAFMSSASLTGYDNIDAISGKADAEVFVYDAEAQGGESELLCVSCNPTGARPTGRELLREADFGTGVWAAAQIPTADSQLYLSRALAADGQSLFFESYEALVARDTNGRQDVYQWQRAQNRGACEAAGAELFVASAGGCLSLISSGESGKDSEFLDASASGADVFIATGSSLVVHDPGLIDVYDARVDGGFPSPAPPKDPCQGETCQSPPPPPPVITPSSALYEGKGNEAPPGKKKKSCKKAKGKAKASARRGGGKSRCAKKGKRARRTQGQGKGGRR